MMIVLVAVLALVTLVAAFLGSKYWHWAHVMVVVLLFFTTFGFGVLAAEAFRARTKFMKQEQQSAQRLKPVEELNAALSRGSDDPGDLQRLISREVQIDEEATEAPSVVELRHRLSLATRRLGRVWWDGQPLGPPDPQTGRVSVGFETGNPLGLEQGALLFAFEQGPANTQNPEQGRQYLAEFRVVAVNGQQLTLEPVLALDPREAKRLLSSQGPWSLYETMPGDSHDLFADFTDDQLRQLMPAGSVEEYLRDGTPWTVDDGEATKEGRDESGLVVGRDDWDDQTRFVYRRRLRDYAYLFNSLAKTRIEMIAKAQALQEDNKKLDDTLASAKRLGAYRTKEQSQLQFDLAGVKKDLAAAQAHQAEVEQLASRGRQLLDQTIAVNLRLTEQLASMQQAQAGGIDLQTIPVPSRGAFDRDAL